MSLNLNCSGRFEDEGPQPPSGLSCIAGSENEAMLLAFRMGDEEQACDLKISSCLKRRSVFVPPATI